MFTVNSKAKLLNKCLETQEFHESPPDKYGPVHFLVNKTKNKKYDTAGDDLMPCSLFPLNQF